VNKSLFCFFFLQKKRRVLLASRGCDMTEFALYPYTQTIPTRWMDNDVYGHVNNVTYYSYFDTVINTWLIREGGLDIAAGTQIGVCAESHCRFITPITFPQDVVAGLRVEKLGRSSVRYGVALFTDHGPSPAAEGWFVHVFVDRLTRKAAPIGDRMRGALQRLLVGGV
jgi:acyl-CoA thioester hydrolase